MVASNVLVHHHHGAPFFVALTVRCTVCFSSKRRLKLIDTATGLVSSFAVIHSQAEVHSGERPRAAISIVHQRSSSLLVSEGVTHSGLRQKTGGLTSTELIVLEENQTWRLLQAVTRLFFDANAASCRSLLTSCEWLKRPQRLVRDDRRSQTSGNGKAGVDDSTCTAPALSPAEFQVQLRMRIHYNTATYCTDTLDTVEYNHGLSCS